MYKYTVFAKGIADGTRQPLINIVEGVGFAVSTGTVTGQIAYEGGNAVQGVSVVAETDGDLGGKSLYLNGTDAYMSVPHKNGDNDFELRNAFTMQIWSKIADLTSSQVLFSKGGQYELAYDPTTKQFDFRIGGATLSLPYEARLDTFFHVAISYDGAGNLGLYAIQNEDSVYSASATGIAQPTATTENVFIGRNLAGNNFYKGFISEVRLWDKALTKEEIENNYFRYASGKESGLLGYWRVNAGVGSGFYDSSKEGVNFNERHGEHVNGEWRDDSLEIPFASQLGYKGVTDENGNYAIVGFPYETGGSLYKFTPIFGVHEFDPVQKTFFVGDGNSILSGVDFKDISSFKVTGSVRYSNTADFGVEGVSIMIDGKPAIEKGGGLVLSDINGQFEAQVPIGKHNFQLVKQGHIFEQDGFRLNPQPIDDDPKLFDYQEPVSGLVFWDTTLVKVVGKVVGGPVEAAKSLGFGLSSDNLGDATLTLTTQKGRDLTSVDRTVQSYNLKEETGVASMEINTRQSYDLVNPKDVKIYPNQETGEYVSYLLPEKYVFKSAVAGNYTFDASKLPVLNLLRTNRVDSIYIDTVATIVSGIYSGYPIDTNPVFNFTDTVGHDEMLITQITVNPDTFLVVVVDTFSLDKRQDLIYRVTPTIEITNQNGGLAFGQQEYFFTNPNDETDTATVALITDGNYNFGHPVFLQMNPYTMKAKLSEQYTNHDSGNPVIDRVPVTDGKLEIRNNLAIRTDLKVIPLDSKGEATYTFAGGVPSTVVDANEPANSYTKTLNITVISGETENIRTVWDGNGASPFRGFVFGGKSIGNNFTTTGPNVITTVLRDPPGSNSYAYLEKETTKISTTFFESKLNGSRFIDQNFTFGLQKVSAIGEGIAVINEFKIIRAVNLNLSWERSIIKQNTIVERFTNNSRLSTSDRDEARFVGHGGDVFVGNAYNIVYGETDDVVLIPTASCQSDFGCQQQSGGFSIGVSTGLAFSPQIETSFVFSQDQIENNVIPNLEALRDNLFEVGVADIPNATAPLRIRYLSYLSDTDPNFGSSNRNAEIWGAMAEADDELWAEKGPSYRMVIPDALIDSTNVDSVHYFNQQIDGWKKALADNEREKLEAKLAENISFDGGTVYEKSITTERSETNTTTFDWFRKETVDTENGWTFNKVGLTNTLSLSLAVGNTNSSSNTTANKSTYGYVLEDRSGGSTSGQSILDYYSVDVGEPSDGFGPVFRTRGGVSSCPVEKEVVTKYHSPGEVLSEATIPGESLDITVDEAVLVDIPVNRSGAFTINLVNNTSPDITRDNIYLLRVEDATNPDGLSIRIDGSRLTSDRAFVVPAGESIQKTVLVEVTQPDVLVYENIKLVFQSLCDSENIREEVEISAYFIPGCSEVTIDIPTDNWVLNTNASPQDTLATKISDYDLAFNDFQKIQFQYKSAGSPLWITDKEFYNANQFTSSNTSTTSDTTWIQNIQNTGSINYQFPMNALPDRNYVIRARTLCEIAPGNVVETPTEELTGTKDTKRPKIFGSPQPANGILTSNDEISVRFDEPIEAGLLTPFNFSVQGVLNGFELKHKASLDFDGANDYVSIPAGLNLDSKSFTISAWVKRKTFGQKQVIFSKGNLANDLIEFGFDASDKIYVQIGSEVYQSNNTNTENEWMHLSFTFNKENRELFGYKNSPAGNEAIFENVAITNPFTGEGSVNLGRSVINQNDYFQGNLHELRIWSKARQKGDIVSQMNNALSGGEIGLIGYWQFNEAFGSTGQDKARFRTAQVFSDWEVLPKGSAVAFDGVDDYVELPTANTIAVSEETDFSLELWFKGASQMNATLFSSGKGDNTDTLPDGNLSHLGNWQIGFNANSQLELNAGGQSIALDAENQMYLNDDWHHLAVSVNRLGNISIFVDGNLQKSETSADYPPLFGLNMWVGARGFKKNTTVTERDQFFNGEIDEVRIWQYARKQAQIMLTRNAKLEGDETGLLAYYPFEKFTESNGVQVKVNSLNDQTAGQETLLATFNGGANYTSETPNIIDSRPITKVDFDFAVNVDEIIITPSEDQRAAIEKSILEISVERVEDKFENRIASPIVWTAFVDRNQIIWGEDAVSYEKTINEGLEFEVEIVNRGGTQETFTIDNLPAWLTASPKTGEIDPSSTKKITFTVNAGLNVGNYEEDIFLTSDFGFNEKLNLKVRVESPKPENWEINPADFQFSMNVVAQLKIDGRISNDRFDEVGVFVGEQNRGIARLEYLPDYDNYQAFLTIYSNVESGDSLQFKIWDDSEGLVYADVSPDLTFSTDTSYGRPSAPLLLETTNFVEQRIDMPAGWKWVSFNLESDSLANLNYIFRNLNSQNNDQIKTYKGWAATYNSPDGWLHESNELEIDKSYQMKNSQAGTIIYEGRVANPLAKPIAIKSGWNQIGYVPNQNLDLNEALASFNATDGDIIKSQYLLAVYDASFGWIGNLRSLVPGQGYMLRAQTAGTLTYPETSVINGRTKKAEENDLTHFNLGNFKLNPHQFPFQMNMMARITNLPYQDDSEATRLLALDGDQIVGIAKAQFNPVTENYDYFMTIYGDGSNKELTFTLTDSEGEVISKVVEAVEFADNSILGRTGKPLPLTLSQEVILENGLDIYPNPFSTETTLRFNLMEDAEVNLEIVDALGRTIRQIAQTDLPAGSHEFNWNGKTASGSEVASGVYFVKAQFGSQVIVKRVVLK